MMNSYKEDFPHTKLFIDGQPLIYLDNAATSQIPYTVLEAVNKRVTCRNANVHRGIHRLSSESTREYEAARQKVADFLNADPKEIAFTSGTTHSINLVAASAAKDLNSSKKIVTTVMEHHSNFLPWQQICKKAKAQFCVIGLDQRGNIDYDQLSAALTENTSLLAVTQCSNVLGTWNNIREICRMAHARGIPVLVDGAQGIAHSHPDIKELDCDYYCFSAHKTMGLTGTGVLYAKKDYMNQLEPFYYGGGMVKHVSIDDMEPEPTPYRLEGGTPNFVGATSLKAALEYREKLESSENIFKKEQLLIEQLESGLQTLERVHILGKPDERRGCLSFIIENAHPYDVAVLLDKKGIAVRSGHHCAMPLLTSLGISNALRVSPAFYNSPEEIAYFLDTLKLILKIL